MFNGPGSEGGKPLILAKAGVGKRTGSRGTISFEKQRATSNLDSIEGLAVDEVELEIQ